MSQTRYFLLNTFHIPVCMSQDGLAGAVVTSNPWLGTTEIYFLLMLYV